MRLVFWAKSPEKDIKPDNKIPISAFFILTKSFIPSVAKGERLAKVAKKANNLDNTEKKCTFASQNAD